MKRVIVKSKLEIKGLNKAYGHEGETLLSGNLYLNNKRVGRVSEGDWGGNMNIHIDPEYRVAVMEEAKRVFNLVPQDYPFDIEYVLIDLLCLKEYEGELKRSKKRNALYHIEMKNNRFIQDFYLGQALLPSLDNLVQIGAIKEEDRDFVKGTFMYLVDNTNNKIVKLYYSY